MSSVSVNLIRPDDIREVFSAPSPETSADLKVFGSTLSGLIIRGLGAFPFSWTLVGDNGKKCVCWYNVKDKKAITTMLYMDDFLMNKGITNAIRKLIEDNIQTAKDSGIEKIEIHSTLSHPLSESWYQRLGFKKTDRLYNISENVVTIFERII